MAITINNLGNEMFSAAKESFGAGFQAVRAYLKDESEKLAITLRTVIAGVASGEIDKKEAKILVQMQRVAMRAVLTSAQGMSLLAVEAAINAALKVVKEFVNGRVGFPLL